MKKLDLTLQQFLDKDFHLYEDNPVIRCFGVSPVIADPSVLTPENTHDGKWHLFCHGLLGVFLFTSDDGIHWTRTSHVLPRAMRPDCVYVDGTYYLYYEQTQSLFKKAISLVGGKWFSEIYLTTSKDLISWTTPTPIIKGDMPYMTSRLGTSVSNPHLIKVGDKYRLYFSAGLTYITDCSFSEPTHISYGESDRLDGGFVPATTPIISPDKNNEYLNLCAGCIKVYELNDCYIGLQNGIYKKGGKSHSTIMLLVSNDGINFTHKKMFLAPTVTKGKNKNWMKQYVYACNLVKCEDNLRLYFNARNCADNVRGKEHIGIYLTDNFD